MVFLDANVLLEITQKNRTKTLQVTKYLETVEDSTAISMLSVHLLMYFGRKEQVDEGVLQGVIAENEVLAVTPEDYLWALVNERGKDFEDALQIATALRLGCKTFVTLDQSLAKIYSGLPITMVSL